MSEAIIRAAQGPVRMAGGLRAFVEDWAWIGGFAASAFGAALAGEWVLILVFG